VTRSSSDAEVTPVQTAPVNAESELRASRARLAAETYAVRRQVERNLHDGVQQHLVALAVNLQLARQLIETDSPALAPVLDEIARDVTEALEGVRGLAHDVYPPLLLDRGLGDAIGALAAAAQRPVRVVRTRLDRFPEDVEATVYFCCADMLRTADSHSVRVAAIHVWQDDGAVNLELDLETAPSVAGTHDMTPPVGSIEDRVGAAGGTLTVTTADGGIRVTATIPLAP
jgi:signal transduction histidine kinase